MNLKKKKGAYLQEMTIEIWRQKGIDYNWDREKPEVKKEESFEGVNSVSRKVKEKENWKKKPSATGIWEFRLFLQEFCPALCNLLRLSFPTVNFCPLTPLLPLFYIKISSLQVWILFYNFIRLCMWGPF